jgi:hypothetical protein
MHNAAFDANSESEALNPMSSYIADTHGKTRRIQIRKSEGYESRNTESNTARIS